MTRTRSKSAIPSSASPLVLRDLRKAKWSWFQNELFDFFAPLVGPYAVVVYLCLCRFVRGNESTVSVSLRDIENLWRTQGYRPALSKTSVVRALRLLVSAGLVRQISAATNRSAAVYALVDLVDLSAELSAEDCDNLARILERQRLRDADSEDLIHLSGVPVGNARKLSKSSGKACGKDYISTEIPGTPEFPSDTSRVPAGTPHLINKKNKKVINPPYPPQGGGCCWFDLFPQDAEPGEAFAAPSVDLRRIWHRAASTVRAGLLDAPAKAGLADGARDWSDCFESLLFAAAAPTHPHPTLLLTSENPAAAVLGFRKYSARWDRALQEAFGQPVSIVVQPNPNHREVSSNG